MKLPQAWNPSSKTKTTATKVEARIDMSAEVAGAGLCPDCRQPMQPMTAGPVETLTCMGCRISLPIADPENTVEPPVEAVQGPSTYLDQ